MKRLGGLLLVLALTSVAWGQSVLTSSDFTFVGAFRPPASVGGSTTDFGYGLTYRYVSGDLRLVSATLNGGVYEMPVPTLTTSPPWNTATASRVWGDIYQDQRYLEKVGGTGGTVLGLYWDDTDSRLYWMYQDLYTSVANDVSFGYSTLNEGTGVGTAAGAWKMPSSIGSKVVKGMTAIPPDFAATYTSGRRLGIGFGGYESVAATGPASMGPALFAIAPPDGVADRTSIPAATTLINHPYNATPYTSPWRGTRDTNYTTEFDGWYPKDGVGYYTWVDTWCQTGVWIDTGDKQGFLVAETLGTGRVWYESSDRWATAGEHRWVVYDPSDLARVAQGTLTADLIQPVQSWYPQHPGISYPLYAGQGGVKQGYTAATYDNSTGLLYVAVGLAYRPDGDIADHQVIYVYQVSSGSSSHTITASASSGGSISPSGSVSVADGGTQAFTITPSGGYTVSSVTVDGSSVGAVTSYTFSGVTGDHTISAVFALPIGAGAMRGAWR